MNLNEENLIPEIRNRIINQKVDAIILDDELFRIFTEQVKISGPPFIFMGRVVCRESDISRLGKSKYPIAPIYSY